VNGCDYCLSAHNYLGQNLAKLDGAEIALNRNGASADPKAHAAVRFAAQVAKSRGHVSDTDVAAVKAIGWTDAQIMEIVAVVAEHVLTNFLNNVALTDIDFPVVRAVMVA
jgi:alkylhydroperoxidase family enzyme